MESRKTDMPAAPSERPLDLPGRLLGSLPEPELLQDYQDWWGLQGSEVSAAVDRAGTPWLRQFDRFGRRIDQILFPSDYRGSLLKGYRNGAVWRFFEPDGIPAAFLLGYLISFYDPGLYCPYTVSLGTAVVLDKYGEPELRRRLLPKLLDRTEGVWQGATWFTEAKGGSDLGANVETVARRRGEHWHLTGEKYFASNIGAELAVVAARLPGAPPDVRGLGLFLVPRLWENGDLNYLVRRLKDKIATRSVPTGEVELKESKGWLLGEPEQGIYHILEVLNLSRVANAVASVAVTHRALAEARFFAQQRIAFGRPLSAQPLMARQIADREAQLQECFALAWEAVRRLNEVWRERPPFSERFHTFRLVAHLAKFWTAETAVQTAKWAMEVNGGMGVLAEYPVERWLREAMILAIWEGPAHRQILDGLEAMERKGAHRGLFRDLARVLPEEELKELDDGANRLLALPPVERESAAEPYFRRLAQAAGKGFLIRLGGKR